MERRRDMARIEAERLARLAGLRERLAESRAELQKMVAMQAELERLWAARLKRRGPSDED